jgi:group I intron endonuclease
MKRGRKEKADLDIEYIAYRITNRVNGKCYIGITSQGLARRWAEHRSGAKRGKRSRLSMAIRRHGVENFTIEHVASAQNWADLCATERALVAQYDSRRRGYNASQGGDVRIGSRPPKSEAFKQYMSQLFKGRVDSPETHARKCAAQMKRTLEGRNPATLRKGPRLPEQQRTQRSISRGGVGRVRYAGVEYACITLAADAAGVTRRTFLHWVHHFGADVPKMLPGRVALSKRVA